MRARCIDCGGSQICMHGKRKTRCIDCGGSELCEHQRRKGYCVECIKQKKKCKNTECNSVIKDNEYQGYCFVCFVLC
jgi:hypothetical protein